MTQRMIAVQMGNESGRDAVDGQLGGGELALRARTGIHHKTREPTRTAVAGPEAFGSGRGVPVPSNTTVVFSAVFGLVAGARARAGIAPAASAKSRGLGGPTRPRNASSLAYASGYDADGGPL